MRTHNKEPFEATRTAITRQQSLTGPEDGSGGGGLPDSPESQPMPTGMPSEQEMQTLFDSIDVDGSGGFLGLAARFTCEVHACCACMTWLHPASGPTNRASCPQICAGAIDVEELQYALEMMGQVKSLSEVGGWCKAEAGTRV